MTGIVVRTKIILGVHIQYFVGKFGGIPGQLYTWIEDSELSVKECKELADQMIGAEIDIDDNALMTFDINYN